MQPPKTSHHAKFRDRSNQLGEKRQKALPCRSFPTFFVTDGQKRDYLSRVSQRVRGATKKKEINASKIYSPVGNLAERAKCPSGRVMVVCGQTGEFPSAAVAESLVQSAGVV